MKVVLTLLSPPPSLNNAFKNVRGKGRVKTAEYKAWRKDAAWQLHLQKPPRFTGQVSVTILVPKSTRSDLDNLNKGILDALQDVGVVANDRQFDPISIGRADVELTTITIEPRVEP
ncbi:RusA family crossover junction endodeoxyribonuclease [Xanthobacter autotrophicus]|uniref:RusA family crossover junction endodeoxyribonuclease n=1 Tax=Xanthobacter autotrophicus TaxID=280 RepID=UPI00372B5977